MPQWAGSSWYYLRYIDPNNDKVLADFSKLNYWLKVDCYNGGMEHVTRHLIYSRFWHRFLYDIGVVSTKEPYKKRTNQGLILGSDGEKMSKSRGNVVDPMEIIDGYGADTLRLFLLFLGEYSVESSWNDDSIKGISRFLDKVYNLKDKVNNDVEYSSDLEIKINKTIKKVSEDIEAMKYNTAISELMILSNEYSNKNNITKKDYVTLLKLLNPFAPHITEELNEIIGKEELAYSKWPLTDNSKLSDETYEMIIQINGKVRGKEIVKLNTSKEDMEAIAKENENIKKYINDKKIVKIIIIQNKIVNIVISE
jgi:leucyl-tRNA synthetase